MKVIYSPNAEIEFKYTCEPHTPARKAAIDAMRHWDDDAQLVAFAESRQGYENSDGFFGVTYPDELDDYHRASGVTISEDCIEAYAWYGAHDGESHELPELEYLELLRQYLAIRNHTELAGRIDKLLKRDT